jgi:hypothetical protein
MGNRCPVSRKLANLTHLGERLGEGVLNRQEVETTLRLHVLLAGQHPPAADGNAELQSSRALPLSRLAARLEAPRAAMTAPRFSTLG